MVAKHMRMAPPELEILRLGHLLDIKLSLLPGNLRVQEHLQQHVTQLILNLVPPALPEGMRQFPALFPEVFDEGLMGLFAVPRAAFGGAEGGNEVNELVERFFHEINGEGGI